MAHPLHHAESSARKFGGMPADYQAIHDWFDASKAHFAFLTHRALRHHSQGIFEAERVFGTSITNSAGKEVPVRWVGEQHVREDCRCIPSLADWFKLLPLQPWMAGGTLEPEDYQDYDRDPRQAWQVAVASGKTLLGYQDWRAKIDAEGAPSTKEAM